MTKREQRVINAFENCVKSGEFTADYAITLIEDNQRYGWLSDAAKDAFYTWLDEYEADQRPAAVDLPGIQAAAGTATLGDPEPDAPADEDLSATDEETSATDEETSTTDDEAPTTDEEASATDEETPMTDEEASAETPDPAEVSETPQASGAEALASE